MCGVRAVSSNPWCEATLKATVLDDIVGWGRVHVGVLVMVGLHEQAELYREGAVPQAAVALVGNPLVFVLTVVVYVAQNAASDE